MRALTISAASSRSSQAIILNPLAAIRALASSTRVPTGKSEAEKWNKANNLSEFKKSLAYMAFRFLNPNFLLIEFQKLKSNSLLFL